MVGKIDLIFTVKFVEVIVDIGVVIDFVLLFGMFVFMCVYVDWLVVVNVDYCG